MRSWLAVEQRHDKRYLRRKIDDSHMPQERNALESHRIFIFHMVQYALIVVPKFDGDAFFSSLARMNCVLPRFDQINCVRPIRHNYAFA